MNSLKLTKVVSLGSLGCLTCVSLYYHNNKDTNTIENLQLQQFRNQKIDSLKAQTSNLKAQLGAIQGPMLATLNCGGSQKKKTENLQWDQRSFTLYCDDKLKESRRANPLEIPEGIFPKNTD